MNHERTSASPGVPGAAPRFASPAVFTLAVTIAISALAGPKKWHPGHYMLAYKESDQSTYGKIFDSRHMKGMQVRYLWTDLEPSKNQYDFSRIQSDLKLLAGHGKFLIIQIQIHAMNASGPYAPKYLQSSEYKGGVFPMKKDGWAVMLWEPSVNERLLALYRAMGSSLDKEPNLAAVNTQETAIDQSAGKDRTDFGYTPEKYTAALIAGQSVLREAFPGTVVMQYMNYVPGVKGETGGFSKLSEIAAHCHAVGNGIGGPDILPGQNPPHYPLFAAYKGKMPLAMAAQNQTWDLNVSEKALVDFAVDKLNLNFACWLRMNSGSPNIDGLIREVENQGGRINAAEPSNLGNHVEVSLVPMSPRPLRPRGPTARAIVSRGCASSVAPFDLLGRIAPNGAAAAMSVLPVDP